MIFWYTFDMKPVFSFLPRSVNVFRPFSLSFFSCGKAVYIVTESKITVLIHYNLVFLLEINEVYNKNNFVYK